MLKTYKNQLFEAVKGSGLDPGDFIPSEEETPDGSVSFVLTFGTSGLQFVVQDHPESPHYLRCTGTTFRGRSGIGPRGNLNEEKYEPFGAVLRSFNVWIENHVRQHLSEKTLPDLWEESRARAAMLQPLNTDRGETFTVEERAQIKAGLETFTARAVAEFQLSQSDREILRTHTEYLAGAAERQNRYDWKAIAFSTLGSIAINLSFDTDTGRRLFELFRESFSVVLLN